MVVKEDGTKWACASCLKGHRVSGCTHVDRELTFVPKKGRPITQCPHCRAERKKRSAHVKCDCGEKPHAKEKCIHLREAEAKAAAGAATPTGTPPTNNNITDSVEQHAPLSDLMPLAEEDDHHCCCPHGGQCSCATIRKVTPEDRPDSVPKLSRARSKPTLKSHQSEGHLTIFANGHHKPVHRNNHTAHECGAPYKLPRSRASQDRLPNIARRSVDSLAAVRAASPATWTQPLSSKPVSPMKESMPTQSERASPQSDFSISHQATLEPRMSIDTTSYNFPEPSASVSSATTFQDFGFPSAQSALSIATSSNEPTMSNYSMPTSALEFGSGSAPDFWSNIDWSTGNLDTQPALTNASSGTISEVDDCPKMDDLTAFDAQYSIDNAAQMQGFDFGNDFSDSTNYSVMGGNYSSLNSNSSNRWSMPTFSSQGNNAVFPIMPANAPVKNMPSQSYGITQPTLQTQNLMTSGDSSAQSHSPVADTMFQGKNGDLSSYDWDQLIPNYSAGVVPSNDGSMNFAVSECGQNGQNTMTTAQAPSVAASNSYDGFDNGFRTMQWNDGVSVPIDQDYVNTYNFDPNWPTGSFDNPWS